MKVTVDRAILELVEGDITHQETEAIVNAANSGLRGGGGVDGAIHREGGPRIMEECRKIGGCPTGEARLTGGGRLKSKYVIHAVGPVYFDGKQGEPELLAGAYESCLQLASRHGITSLSFPSLSTGAYRYPIGEAARIALRTVMEYLKGHEDITLVRIVLFGKEAYKAYEAALKELTSRQ